MQIDLEKVKNAANSYGFNLEFKAKKIFVDNGFETEINKLIKTDDQLLEVDLVAGKYKGRPFVAECKGTRSSSVLILIKEAIKNKSSNYLNFSSQDIRGTASWLPGFQGVDSPVFCTFTGDFFSNNPQKGMTRVSKNEDENNFFKGQAQIMDAIHAVAGEPLKEHQDYITPLIITNATICVVDYNDLDNPVVTSHKWVLHKVKTTSRLQFEPKNEEESCFFMLPVVNIHHLDEFIKIAQNINSSTRQIPLSSGLVD